MNKWQAAFTFAEATTYIRETDSVTRSIDAAFADGERAFYTSRTENELRALAHQAWLCNEADGYAKAKCYLAVRIATGG